MTLIVGAVSNSETSTSFYETERHNVLDDSYLWICNLHILCYKEGGGSAAYRIRVNIITDRAPVIGCHHDLIQTVTARLLSQ
jgi:hypothetical protein